MYRVEAEQGKQPTRFFPARHAREVRLTFDVAAVRSRFPALERRVGGRRALYLDGPGGTQVPRSVIRAMAGYLEAGGSNLGGPFEASRYSDEVVAQARSAMCDLFHATSPNEIVFGQNMTSLTLATSRALARTWGPGDEVVVTRLDHDANVWPWVIAAGDAGASIRYVDFDPDAGCVLAVDDVAAVVSDRTRLVAVTHASNAVGTVVDVAGVASIARAVGALVYVDAVHYTPHGPIDVGQIGCDFLAASAYKFFGPHTGVLYGREELLAELEAVKIRPAPSDPPGKWETGTQSFESLAGVTAAVDYLASLGSGSDRPAALRDAMETTRRYERELSTRFLAALGAFEGVRLFGLDTAEGRTPTFAVAVDGLSPYEVARRLGEVGIFVWAGHYYAVEVMQRLGVLDAGGLVRIGFVHYTSPEEVEVVAEALGRLAAGRSLDGLPTSG
jgi:cysteine desulfurase family protein (TIGR01976 family)